MLLPVFCSFGSLRAVSLMFSCLPLIEGGARRAEGENSHQISRCSSSLQCRSLFLHYIQYYVNRRVHVLGGDMLVCAVTRIAARTQIGAQKPPVGEL